MEVNKRQLNGVTRDCLPVKEALNSLTPLQLGAFHALWNLHYPTRDKAQPAPARKRSLLLSRATALQLYPIDVLIDKPQRSRVIPRQVYDRPGRYWRIRHQDDHWEEHILREMERFVKNQAQDEAARKT